MKTVLIVGVGGCIGSMFRYLTALYFSKLIPSPFPYGTFIVNILGCLVIGLIYGFSTRFQSFSPEWRIFLATGICGGYTTFSSFAYENVKLLQGGDYVTFSWYAISSFVLGLLATFIGMELTKISI